MFCLRLPILKSNFTLKLKNMSIFVHKNNPITGKNEWELEREDYDFHQEVARAAYADMLHDSSRNALYYAGLRAAISAKHAAGEEAHVLDIGTGTGLLSMMAARCGADSIIACEAFDPMAHCARKVIEMNGLMDKIKVVGKRSTEMKVGTDMPRKANILVTEVFDTELIGEGANSTFSHAHQHLLEPGSIVVPSSATVYAQLIEGNLFHKWQRLLPVKNASGTTMINIPHEMNQCPGTSVVHDVQLSALQKDEFKSLTSAIPVAEFDWSNPKIPFKRNIQSIIKPENSGICYGIFFWWDLKMDTIGDIILSCAPKWSGNKYWRDHWIQAIYYFPQEINVIKNQEIILHTCHDEYSFWFYTNDHLSKTKDREDSKLPLIECKSSKELPIPNCNPTCGLHQSINYTRIGNLNDPLRREKYRKSLENQVNENTKALVTGDGTLLPLIIKKLGAQEVYTTDEALWIKDIAKYNKLDIKYITKEEITEQLTEKLTLICSEPYYSAAILPWYNLAFWYTRSELKLSNEVTIVPCSGTIYAMPVELEDLWKIRAPLGEVEGFTMKPFDDLIETSSDISDCNVEPQPLWEYPNKSLGDPQPLIKFDFTKSIAGKIEMQGEIQIKSGGMCHAVSLWMDWQLNENNIISTGPTLTPIPGTMVTWDKHSRQGVYLIRPYTQVQENCSIKYSIVFSPHNGHLDFNFNIIQ